MASRSLIQILLFTSHITAEQSDHRCVQNTASAHANPSIPSIDLSQSDAECAIALFNAATTYGFFRITNHSVPVISMNNALQCTQTLFAQNSSTKLSLSQNSSHWGYIPFGGETTDSKRHRQRKGDTKEGFYLQNKQHFNASSAIDSAHKRNQWPFAPNSECSQTLRAYLNDVHSLSLRIARIIALSLNLSAEFFERRGVRDASMELLSLLHYTAQQSRADEGVFANGQHTDYQLFTILLLDFNDGLQVLYDDGDGEDKETSSDNAWIDVGRGEGEDALIVNVADTLSAWTNGRFKSAVHRVITDGAADRYSMPYFVGVNADLMIGCLPNTVGDGAQCKHCPFRAGDYLEMKLNAILEAEHSEL